MGVTNRDLLGGKIYFGIEWHLPMTSLRRFIMARSIMVQGPRLRSLSMNSDEEKT